MKAVTKFLCLFLASFCFASRLEAETPSASFAYVIAIGGNGKSFIEIDGKDLNAGGHPAGMSSGWLGVPAGEVKLKMEHELFGIADATTKLKEGDQKVFVLHTVTSPGRKEGRPSKKESRVTVLDVPTITKGTGSKKRVIIFSVSTQTDAKILLGGEEVILKPMQAVVCKTGGLGLFPTVEIVNPTPTDGQERLPIASVNLESSGVQLVVVFDGDEKQPLMAATVGLPEKQ